MDGPREYYAKWNKSNWERQILKDPLKGGSFKWIYFVKYTKTRREKERKGKERKEKRKRSVIMVEGIDSSSPKCRPDTKYNGCSRLSNIPRVIFECIYTFKPI